jgi:hypothetical protein
MLVIGKIYICAIWYITRKDYSLHCYLSFCLFVSVSGEQKNIMKLLLYFCHDILQAALQTTTLKRFSGLFSHTSHVCSLWWKNEKNKFNSPVIGIWNELPLWWIQIKDLEVYKSKRKLEDFEHNVCSLLSSSCYIISLLYIIVLA